MTPGLAPQCCLSMCVCAFAGKFVCVSLASDPGSLQPRPALPGLSPSCTASEKTAFFCHPRPGRQMLPL